MNSFVQNLTHLYREQIERHRNRPFLRAAMAACALVSTANGSVSFRERMRLDQLLETLEALRVFDPHEGVELFNEFVETLRDIPLEGRERALEAIDTEVAQSPDKAELLIRICLAVSERTGGVPTPVQGEIESLCERLGVAREVCPEQAAQH